MAIEYKVIERGTLTGRKTPQLQHGGVVGQSFRAGQIFPEIYTSTLMEIFSWMLQNPGDNKLRRREKETPDPGKDDQQPKI